MTGLNTSLIEEELFTMIYALSVMAELIKDKLLTIPVPLIVDSRGYDTLIDLSKKYPLPNYAVLADYSYKILSGHIRHITFTREDLERLFRDVEANNGYIL